MIDGGTSMVGLLGWPVEHSLSPAMHNAAFDALGMNWRYVPLPVRPGQVPAAVRGLRVLGFVGANVTVPHKEAALAAADEVHPTAQALGAVNTLVISRAETRPARVEGHNTDAQGFIAALRCAGYDPKAGGTSVVVGAGGAARAIVFGLLLQGEGEVVVLNRSRRRALQLISELGSRCDCRSRLRGSELTRDALVDEVRQAELLVNATTVGMWPGPDASIWPDTVRLPSGLTVFDLVYNPLQTMLLRQARAAGATAVDGLEMLVQQGVLAFGLWTHHQHEPKEVASLMRSACAAQMYSQRGGLC
jgi:shikimate dehydrogenase